MSDQTTTEQRKGESAQELADRRKITAVVSQELANAEGRNSDELQANRTKAMDYYFGKPRGDEVADRSGAISMDVADMINANLAMIVPMLSTDAMVEFEPGSEDDEEQAKAESDAVNDLVMEYNNGFIEIQEAVKDALLLKNGCMKVMMREREEIETLDFSEASDEEVALWVSELPANSVAMKDGTDMRKVTIDREFIVCAVPIENVSYQAGFAGKLQDIRYFGEELIYTRSDLVEMGVDPELVMSLKSDGEIDNPTAQARDLDTATNGESYSPATQPVRCFEVFQRIDLDEDGIAERYKVLMAGEDVVLMWEPADLIPYAMGSPFLNPHRLTGESMYDHLKSVQDVKTALKRQHLDNVTLINNGRYIYDPSNVVEEDILNPIAGGGIRSRNPANSVIPVMIPDVQSGIMVAMGYEDQVRSERGGAALDMIGPNEQLMSETATGIERQYGSRELMSAMICRNLSEQMIKNTFLIAHEYLRRWANKPISVRRNGAFVETDPQTWPVRKRVNVKTGMSAGERGHMQSVLGQHMQLQTLAMQNGLDGILASAETLFRTNQDWLRLAGVDNPERLAVDPQSDDAIEVKERQIASAEGHQQQIVEQQEKIHFLTVQLEQAKLSEDARQADQKNDLEYYKADLDAAVEEAKLTGQGTIDLEKERLKNENTKRNPHGSGQVST